MPEIRAFRALRYNPAKINNPSFVVAPPYDVISAREQEKLYRINPYNVIRLELGKQTKKDTKTNNCYTRAGATLEDWKSQKVLIREAVPAFYVSVQDYREEGKKKRRIGFYAAMKLDEKAVLKHENTLTGPKEDRFKLLKEVRTNLSPIFGLFEDKKGLVQSVLKKSFKRAPIMDVSLAGVRHRLYLEKQTSVIRRVTAALKTKPMFIADGHHRFEVACRFKKWMQTQKTDRGREWEYVLAYFSDCLHNPFKIFPTHRLIRIPEGIDFHKTLKEIGSLEKAPNLKVVLSELSEFRAETRDKKYRFGLYSRKEGFWFLTLDFRAGTASAVDKLDVAVLHQKILEPCFGIHLVPAKGGSASGGEKSQVIDFTRDAQEACRKVRSGLFDLAVFLRPTSLKEMLHVSKLGLKMPQKSTYFYPKLLTGLVFHELGKETE
jgi:uncharacterized protein (DUF1015 family)